MTNVFLCRAGFDGILCGVYDAYASRLPLEECRLEIEEEYELTLFCEYRQVPLDQEKAGKVSRTIQEKMPPEAYVYLYRSSLHKSPDRADWMFRFIQLGLQYGMKIFDHLKKPAVFAIYQMNRYVGNEAHFLVEFIRFQRLKSGLYFSKVGPENNVLELVADHFADRFPEMDWIIYDERRRRAALHSESGKWFMKEPVTDEELDLISPGSSEDVYVDLWKSFFHTIAIEERKNPKCQRTMLPLRYRKYMTEFQ